MVNIVTMLTTFNETRLSIKDISFFRSSLVRKVASWFVIHTLDILPLPIQWWKRLANNIISNQKHDQLEFGGSIIHDLGVMPHLVEMLREG